MYLVREIFGPTIQGEGAHTGMPCVFLRFARCNLRCSWCDTDFDAKRSRRMSAEDVLAKVQELDIYKSRKLVVTGGEPSLQWQGSLPLLLKNAEFEIHMESNGTSKLTAPVDWLTVSPKPQFHEGKTRLENLAPSECKVVVDESVSDESLQKLRGQYPSCENWFLQPCDTGNTLDSSHSLEKAMGLVSRNPDWRLSLQMHKVIGVP